MRDYMPKVGTLGLDMMTRTCTGAGQPGLRRRSGHGEEVPRVAGAAADRHRAVRRLALHRGKPNGYLSYRSHIWTDTDPNRTGMLDFVFEDGFGFERYVDYLLDVPMYFSYRGGEYVDAAGLSFRDFLQGKLPVLPGALPTMKDWADHMTTAFPEVRLKKYLEMRGADGGPWNPPVRAAGLLDRAAVRRRIAGRGLGPGEGLHHGRAQRAARRRAEARAEASLPWRHGARAFAWRR
jgi:glutamate--cysteine ligase